MELEIGFSPCPNDTFMFFAMLHGKVDTEGLSFKPFIADVEELNQRVLRNDIQVSKASYRTIANALTDYNLLQAGSALGRGCGPLLISRDYKTVDPNRDYKVMIPGVNTTANFLLETFYPQLKNKTPILFSKIENALVMGQADLGVIIHENRFTYQQHGLVEMDDLGKRWETETGLPIPLGGIVVSKALDETTRQKVNRVLRRSVEYAFANPDDTMPYVRRYAQAMSDDVMQKHIDLYVNQFSISLGDEGKAAVEELMRRNNATLPDKFFVSF